MKNDLFGYEKPRKKREIMAHMDDVGQGGVFFKCKCGWVSGWIQEAEDWSDTKILSGIPCKKCNL
jgi:hypothetical protein